MTFAEVAAELVYHRGLTLDEIADLTDWQIRAIYYRPRDDDGNLIRETPADDDNPREQFAPPDEAGVPREAIDLAAEIRPQMDGGFITMWWRAWRQRGWPDERIMQRWREYLPSGN